MRVNCSANALGLIAILLVTAVESTLQHFPPYDNTDDFPYDLLTPTARASEEEVKLNFRLPNETYPEHYSITLTTNVHKGEKPFQGEVVIDITVVKTTNKIVLHARDLQFSKVLISSTATKETEELSYEYEQEREFLILSRKNGKEFVAESKWMLTIIYNGTLRDDMTGFYISKYIDNSGNKRYLATTKFEPFYARRGFPCYDEPDKRVNFTISILHSPTYKAISNMPVNEALSSPNKTVFLTTAAIPTYIVAFIVSDFENSTGMLNGLTTRTYSRGNAKQSQEFALTSAMLITQHLSKYFGVDLMLPKIDHVAIPDFLSGGMENWGLITYPEENLLYDENKSDIFSQTDIATIFAHEIAHQWFGDIVTIKWWTYLWLKEGFATLFSYRGLADTHPEWGVWQQFLILIYQEALISDGSAKPRPMTSYVETPTQIWALYNVVSYSKAGAVLYMWNNALTDKVFQRGLRNYLIYNQYTAAVEEDLFTAIQNAAKEENYKIPAEIDKMIGSWSRQGGFPLLTITRNYEDGSFTVKQEAFHYDTTIKDEKTWYVPVNYAVASKPDFRNTEATHYLQNITEMKIDAKIARQDWLIINKQSAYYYRVKYDEDNYKLIIDALIKRPSIFHTHNRAQLLHDAFALILVNRMNHGLLLQMMTYLKKEEQYAPWASARDIFNRVNKYLRGDRNYNDLKLFIADQTEQIYAKLGANDVPGEQHFQKYTRPLIIELACLAGVEDCLRETNNKLKDLARNNVAIEPNVESAIYCNGLKQSSDEIFDFVYNQLMNSTDKKFRGELISYLGCSQNKNQLKKFIYSTIDHTNNLHDFERRVLLRSVYTKSDMGLLACIEFLNENWEEYDNLVNEALYSDVLSMSQYVVNKNQEEKYLAMMEKVKSSKNLDSILESQVRTKIDENFKWLERNRDPIMTWLEQYHAEKLRSSSATLAASGVLIAFTFHHWRLV